MYSLSPGLLPYDIHPAGRNWQGDSRLSGTEFSGSARGGKCLGSGGPGLDRGQCAQAARRVLWREVVQPSTTVDTRARPATRGPRPQSGYGYAKLFRSHHARRAHHDRPTPGRRLPRKSVWREHRVWPRDRPGNRGAVDAEPRTLREHHGSRIPAAWRGVRASCRVSLRTLLDAKFWGVIRRRSRGATRGRERQSRASRAGELRIRCVPHTASRRDPAAQRATR